MQLIFCSRLSNCQLIRSISRQIRTIATELFVHNERWLLISRVVLNSTSNWFIFYAKTINVSLRWLETVAKCKAAKRCANSISTVYNFRTNRTPREGFAQSEGKPPIFCRWKRKLIRGEHFRWSVFSISRICSREKRDISIFHVLLGISQLFRRIEMRGALIRSPARRSKMGTKNREENIAKIAFIRDVYELNSERYVASRT